LVLWVVFMIVFPFWRFVCHSSGPGLNRPGESGDSTSWEGWSHVRWFVEEVPAGAA
jgi:hypothetical protein